MHTPEFRLVSRNSPSLKKCTEAAWLSRIVTSSFARDSDFTGTRKAEGIREVSEVNQCQFLWGRRSQEIRKMEGIHLY